MIKEVQKIINVLNNESKPSITIQVVDGKVLVDYNISAGVNAEDLAFMAASLVISAYSLSQMAASDAAKATPPVATKDFAEVFQTFLFGKRELPDGHPWKQIPVEDSMPPERE